MLKDNTSQESVERFESLDIAENKISELEEANAAANERISQLQCEIDYLKSQGNNSK